jgi:hypothetical protein
LHFCLGWPQIMILLPMASYIAGITGTHHYTWLVGWDGSLANFLPGLALTYSPHDL